MAIYLYTGDGAGKTTNALGLALRSIGHNHRVLMVQLLKWNKETGEYKARELIDNFDIYQFGRKGWHGEKNLTTEDKKLAMEGLTFAVKRVTNSNVYNSIKYDLLILDELNLVVYYGLVPEKVAIDALDEITLSCPDLDVVITGRHAPESLKNRADYVNEINTIKEPKIVDCKEGIQY